MNIGEFIEKIDPYLIDDQPVTVKGQFPGRFDLAGIFPDRRYVVNVGSKKKRVFVHFVLNDSDGVQFLGYMLRDLLYQVMEEYPREDLVIMAEMHDAEEGMSNIGYFLADRLWANVKCIDENTFECGGCDVSCGGGILEALSMWNRGYIEHMYTRF